MKNNRSHGDCSGGKTKEYFIWRAMKDRCLNPNNKNYSTYGGKGVTICERWINDYAAFLADMGRANGRTLDRQNNNEGYSPENCRWVDWKTQQNNRSNNRKITVGGVVRSIQECAQMTGLKYGTIVMRLHRGWSEEKALSHGA